MKRKSFGLEHFIGLIFVIGIIIIIVKWIFHNIVGVLGIVAVIWGAYKWYKNHKADLNTKIPYIIASAGLAVSVGWFAWISNTNKDVTEKGNDDSHAIEETGSEVENPSAEASAAEDINESPSDDQNSETRIVTASPIESNEEFLSIYQEVQQKYAALNDEFQTQYQNYDDIAWGKFSVQFNQELSTLRDEIGQGVNPPVRFNLAVASGSLYNLWSSYDNILSDTGTPDDQELADTMKKDIESNLKKAEELLK